ncbi:hypothetical protein ALP64_203885 [Pseudomonas syringae pv. actinidiae]|nr:hypothetical protein ALP64_203885 [Pseudomonas syringae pv. actinidiae]
MATRFPLCIQQCQPAEHRQTSKTTGPLFKNPVKALDQKRIDSFAAIQRRVGRLKPFEPCECHAGMLYRRQIIVIEFVAGLGQDQLLVEQVGSLWTSATCRRSLIPYLEHLQLLSTELVVIDRFASIDKVIEASGLQDLGRRLAQPVLRHAYSTGHDGARSVAVGGLEQKLDRIQRAFLYPMQQPLTPAVRHGVVNKTGNAAIFRHGIRARRQRIPERIRHPDVFLHRIR